MTDEQENQEVNPILHTIEGAIRLFRELGSDSTRDYGRAPSTGMQVLTHTLSFGAGVALGAGLGVLFAPKEGEKTRDEIKAAATEAFEGASDYLSNMVPSPDEPEEGRSKTNGASRAQPRVSAS